jgi:hypothetical protein
MNRKRVPKAIVHQAAAQFYDRFVEGIKKRVRTAQVKVALAANAELVLHYWEIGRDILASQKREGWGAKVVDRLANDLQREFPKLPWLLRSQPQTPVAPCHYLLVTSSINNLSRRSPAAAARRRVACMFANTRVRCFSFAKLLVTIRSRACDHTEALERVRGETSGREICSRALVCAHTQKPIFKLRPVARGSPAGRSGQKIHGL